MKSIISFVIRFVPRPLLQRVSPLVMKVFSKLNSGDQVKCPVCNHSYRKFLPYGRIARENALCPSCLSLERHRLMWLFLQEKTNFFTAPLRVLHVAPEHCFIERFEALGNLEYITADIESPLAKVKMDVHEIPFPENSFDVIFCNHVLEHVQDDLKACAEFNRVLRPEGWGILQSPVYPMEKTLEDDSITDPAERERIFGQRDHVRKFGKDYATRLRKSGLQIEENRFVKELQANLVEQYALPIEEVIFVCRKGY
ncbi:methyltransferase domain-containing protein [Algoriphagus halophytocola]|uniref:Methyltransferase domain-containing protein n=1 Tax=Algoriphagus halophytocola TaxID=2991499 RepID=A0ABY6MNV5_9BACT|nr:MULTISPECIES: class I SAM-dependent methyltransferase [unclassified Algoriphagus]UZD24689.1 methyltransferase domain-containing protein [Algoriphagus sp. TR-M5]WBL42057.1 methyltransferase domain-containing protein [Algoriphagus sp. TR-M9]